MNKLYQDPFLLDEVDPINLEMYLISKNWERIIYKEDFYSVYQKIDDIDNIKRVWLPLNKSVDDYGEVLQEFFIKISDYENQSIRTLTDDILSFSIGDVIKLRTEDPMNVHSNTLLFDDGIILFNQGKDMLCAAAKSIHEKKAVHSPGRTTQISNYINSLRIGQTEKGSFIARIISPIKKMDSLSRTLGITEVQPSYERNVIQHMLRSLDLLEKAATYNLAKGKFIFEPFEELIDEGVSANLCESITGSSYERYKFRPLSISVSWSYLLNEYKYPDEPRQLEFPTTLMEYIDKAADKFRESSPITIELIGTVSILRRERLRQFGIISLQTRIEDEPRVVRVELPPDLYKYAIDAHRSGSQFKIKGELMKRNRIYYLENPRGVQVLE